MKGNAILVMVPLVAALHIAVLSIAFGTRNAGYIATGIISGELVWGGVFLLLSDRMRPTGVAAGVVIALVVQQVAYQLWKAELPDFWWALGQFLALQCLVAYVAGCSGVRNLARGWISAGVGKEARSAPGKTTNAGTEAR